MTFSEYLKQTSQKKILLISSIFYLVIYFFFHWAYPFPNTTADTGDYIFNAITGYYGGYRPDGYSWFLTVFRVLSGDISFTGTIQFFIYAFAILFFAMSLIFLIEPVSKKYAVVLLIALSLSPMSFYLTHWIMSDSIFISLTLLWFASGLLLLHKFSWKIVALHLILIFLCIKVRYAGMFYPFISIVIFMFSNKKWAWAFSLIALLIPTYVYIRTKDLTKNVFKTEIFSALGGWVNANNAVVMIPYVKLSDEEINDPDLRIANTIIRAYPDSIYSIENTMNTSFIWAPGFPGKKMIDIVLDQKKDFDYVQAWVYSGYVWGKYAKILIAQNPFLYFRLFILHNAKEYFWPKVNNYAQYEQKELDSIYKRHFEIYNITELKAEADLMPVLNPYVPATNFARWLLCIGAFIYLIYLLKNKLLNSAHKKIFILLGIYIVLYSLFSIVTAPVILRYLVPVYPFQAALFFLALINWKKKTSIKEVF
jgi:hypothetical protein